MTGTPANWTLLGIAPTTDAASIRSAFRVRMLELRCAGRHEDVAAVQPLREAYMAALRAAVDTAPCGSAAGPAPAPAPAPTPAPTPAPALAPAPTPPPPPAFAPDPGPDAARPAAAPAPAPGPTGVDLPARARAAVVALLPDHTLPPHLLRRWQRLRRQPAWMWPEAACALQQALAMRLLELQPVLRAHQPPSDAVAAAMRQSQRWLALALHVGDCERWWPAPPPDHAGLDAEIQALWWLACRVWVDQLLQLLHRGQLRASLSHLGQMLRHPVLQALDSRARWLEVCAPELAAWPDLPAELLEALLQGVGLQDLRPGEFSNAAVDKLVDQHQQHQRRRLLQRIAQRRLAHPHISPAVAVALLQPAIRPEDRRAVRTALDVDGQAWLTHMRQAIAWLREHAPDALDATEPAVLRWWCGPQLTPQGWWELAAMMGATLGGVAGLALFGWTFGMQAARAEAGPALAGLLAFLLAGMAAGARLGWRAAVATTWLHMHWATWLYPAWRRCDAAWARRIPLFGPLLLLAGIWLSRDVVVLGALLQWAGAHTLWPYLAFLVWRVGLWAAARGRF